MGLKARIPVRFRYTSHAPRRPYADVRFQPILMTNDGALFGGVPLVQSTRHGLGGPTVARWSRKAPPPTDIGLCDPRHSVSRERGIPLRDCPRHELHIFKRVTYFQEGLTSCLLAILANKFSAGRRAETRGAPEPISRCTRSLEQALKKSRPRDWPRRLKFPLTRYSFERGLSISLTPLNTLPYQRFPKWTTRLSQLCAPPRRITIQRYRSW